MDKILNAIDQIIKAFTVYRDAVAEYSYLDNSSRRPLVNPVQIKPDAKPVRLPLNIPPTVSFEDSFQNLKETLFTEKWPTAVNPKLICDLNNEKEKLDRGKGIVDLMIEEELTGKNFLDFGCGGGYVAYIAATSENPAISVGYDLQDKNWQQFNAPNLLLTSDLTAVMSKGPYDIVLLFDVLDHMTGEQTPVECLKTIKAMLNDNGKIYVRCHPFTSRHAIHTYTNPLLNKAFIQLVFNEEELNKIFESVNMDIEYVRKIVYPLATYQAWFREAGFKVMEERIIKEQVEKFFETPIIVERILKNTGHANFPAFQMQQSFVDYVLTKNLES